jgi:hypothetical protein
MWEMIDGCILTSMSRVQAVTSSGLMLLMREPLEDIVKVDSFASRDLVVCSGGEVGESTVTEDEGVKLFVM